MFSFHFYAKLNVFTSYFNFPGIPARSGRNLTGKVNFAESLFKDPNSSRSDFGKLHLANKMISIKFWL